MTFIRLGSEVVVTLGGWLGEHAGHGEKTTFTRYDDDAVVSGWRCACGASFITALGQGLHPRASAAPKVRPA